jgi:outer membrane protein assembly factor BamD (BamD/ComL family)
MKAGYLRSTTLLAFLIWLPGGVAAQNQPAPRLFPFLTTENSCTPKLFHDAEQAFVRRDMRGSEGRIQVRKLHELILKYCPDAVVIPEIKRSIAVMDEEAAERRFNIANYCFRLYKERGSGLKGAQSRFSEIVERYPNYSKIDAVLFFLAETYFFDKDGKSATGCYQRLLAEHPNSEYADEARTRIREITERK